MQYLNVQLVPQLEIVQGRTSTIRMHEDTQYCSFARLHRHGPLGVSMGDAMNQVLIEEGLRLPGDGNAHQYHLGRPVFFQLLYRFLRNFLSWGCSFLATFFAGAFFAVFVVTIFFVAFFGDDFLDTFFGAVFFAAFLTGVDFRTSATAVTAAPIAVSMAPATSDAIAIPAPTVSPALSAIVFSAQTPQSLCSYA